MAIENGPFIGDFLFEPPLGNQHECWIILVNLELLNLEDDSWEILLGYTDLAK